MLEQDDVDDDCDERDHERGNEVSPVGHSTLLCLWLRLSPCLAGHPRAVSAGVFPGPDGGSQRPKRCKLRRVRFLAPAGVTLALVLSVVALVIALTRPVQVTITPAQTNTGFWSSP